MEGKYTNDGENSPHINRSHHTVMNLLIWMHFLFKIVVIEMINKLKITYIMFDSRLHMTLYQVKLCCVNQYHYDLCVVVMWLVHTTGETRSLESNIMYVILSLFIISITTILNKKWIQINKFNILMCAHVAETTVICWLDMRGVFSVICVFSFHIRSITDLSKFLFHCN
jgi:hypothetical protein